MTSFPFSDMTSSIVFPNVFDSKSFLLYVLVKSSAQVPTKGLAITVPTLYSFLSSIFLAILHISYSFSTGIIFSCAAIWNTLSADV